MSSIWPPWSQRRGRRRKKSHERRDGSNPRLKINSSLEQMQQRVGSSFDLRPTWVWHQQSWQCSSFESTPSSLPSAWLSNFYTGIISTTKWEAVWCQKVWCHDKKKVWLWSELEQDDTWAWIREESVGITLWRELDLPGWHRYRSYLRLQILTVSAHARTEKSGSNQEKGNAYFVIKRNVGKKADSISQPFHKDSLIMEICQVCCSFGRQSGLQHVLPWERYKHQQFVCHRTACVYAWTVSKAVL